MSNDKLKTFDVEFRGWLTAFHQAHGFPDLSEAEYVAFRQAFDRRIPTSICAMIGEGLQSGFLQTEHFKVRLSHPGNDPWGVFLRPKGSPWWEFFPQLAEAVRIEPVARAADLTIKLEDRRMDITLSRDDHLIAYLEVKVDAKEAKALVQGMQLWGAQREQEQPEHAICDDLKKVRYLQRCRPMLFGIRAIGYAADFRVRYGTDGTLSLEHLDQTFVEAVRQAASEPHHVSVVGRATAAAVTPTTTPQHTAPQLDEGIDVVANTLTALCPELDLDPGTKGTALNVYAQIAGIAVIVLGFMQNGELWTELKDFSDAECDALVDSFSSLPIQLDITPRDGKRRGGRPWRTGRQKANWRELEPIALAQAMRTFLDRIR